MGKILWKLLANYRYKSTEKQRIDLFDEKFLRSKVICNIKN